MLINKAWFTLVELIIAITIVVILSVVTYVPYSHYQNKAKLKLASREISQGFYEARNMASSWLKDVVWNRSIWFYLDTMDPNNDKLTFFSYPHDIEEINIINFELSNVEIIKEMKLQKWIKINNLKWSWGWTEYNNLLFYFDSITWESKIYNFNGSFKDLIIDDKIDIIFSFKNSNSPTLKSTLVYFSKTNIVDYK